MASYTDQTLQKNSLENHGALQALSSQAYTKRIQFCINIVKYATNYNDI